MSDTKTTSNSSKENQLGGTKPNLKRSIKLGNNQQNKGQPSGEEKMSANHVSKWGDQDIIKDAQGSIRPKSLFLRPNKGFLKEDI